MAITKIYKGDVERSDINKIYKGTTLLYEKVTGPTILNYLTFQSTSNFTLKVYDNTKHWDGTLYYSTDTTTWIEWDGTTTLSSVGNKLYLAGSGNTIIAGPSDNCRWVLAGSNIECIGNIENLLDYETVASGGHPAMANSCYGYMFYGCTSLTTAPSLPATTLADYCYYYMFEGCTAFKVSTTKAGSYQYAWRIPTSGYGTTASGWNTSMLSNTGGPFTSNPSINTTYYVENAPV